MLLNPFHLHVPKTLEEACALQNKLTNNRLLAGGTLLLNSLKILKRKGGRTPTDIISLHNIPELKGIHANSKELTIGAMTTLDELQASPLLTGALVSLKTACRGIGTTPIRNMGTVGGNIASRYTWTELPAVLMAMEANFHFAKTPEERVSISADKFFENNAHVQGILTHVTIPIDLVPTASVYIRLSKSATIDTPLLGICVKASFKNKYLSKVRVGVNNATTFSRRDRQLEHFLEGKKADPTTIETALIHRTPEIYKTSSEYKQHMFDVAMRQALTALAGAE